MARTASELSASEIVTVEELDAIANNSVIYKNDSGAYAAVALGANGTVLTSSGATSAPTFSAGGGSGDVVGPASSTDNAIVRFDGTTGKLVQNSAATIADTTGDITAGKYNKVTITPPASGATLTIADGATLTVSANATVSGTNTGDQTSVSGNAGTVTVGDAGGDTTTWVLLGTSQTGNLSPSTDAGLTYNATTNALTATTFVGDLSGNATTATDTASKTGTGSTYVTNTAPQISTIELGNASDTTLARVSAGVMSVEGVRVITSSGTTSGTILKNNGTTFVASTETYASPGATGNVMTSDGTNWTSAAPTAAFWTTMPGTPTRVSNTTFTVTGDVTSYVAKGMVIKWTETSTVRTAMVSIPSTYSAPNTTITIVGDTMASIDASSLKYAIVGAESYVARFAIAGTIGATTTGGDAAGAANAYYATEPMRVLAADLQAGTAGTTNNTTVDINKNTTTMFTTKPTLATTVASSPTPFTADSATSLALGDKVTIDIDAIQTTPSVDLYVQLYLWPTRLNSLS